jgi:hypothetical protein
MSVKTKCKHKEEVAMFESIVNLITFRSLREKLLRKKLLDCLKSGSAEGFLTLLLNLMSLVLLLDKDYRKNIKEFQGKYLFKSLDNSIVVSTQFKNGNMDIAQKAIDAPNITVIFKDSKALMNFLLSPKPDILNSMLKQDITLDGNLNYLYKFAYMATHLRIMATNALT